MKPEWLLDFVQTLRSITQTRKTTWADPAFRSEGVTWRGPVSTGANATTIIRQGGHVSMTPSLDPLLEDDLGKPIVLFRVMLIT
ncbi:hypothetical protein EVAR_3703_1 [Eumeta japonica]|uniref:Uncharacterized protein n=1 Tax=Eumeta variegata TaxID=151549 RepID=A0A4C1SS11_EUMVA|nr:hypothetical protein EVAR_3703_1 [Eumeta japonica]